MRIVRKTILAAVCALGASQAYSAAATWGAAGCGVGSIVWGSESMQTSAYSTNMSFYQSISIFSELLNCQNPPELAAQQREFLFNNYAELSREMSRGEGDVLNTFARTFGCSDTALPKFRAVMQNSFEEIYTSPGAMASFDVVQSKVQSTPELTQHCNKIS